MAQTVLVVEDDPFVRMCTSDMVAECGFEVIEAADAEAALDVLRVEADHILALVTDVRMPGRMDGVDLANLVAASWPDIRVLVTSGFDDGRAGALPKGIKFMQKPWRALDMITYVMDATKSVGSAH
jgi:DNA-binding NtrC family response regulator